MFGKIYLRKSERRLSLLFVVTLTNLFYFKSVYSKFHLPVQYREPIVCKTFTIYEAINLFIIKLKAVI